MVEVTEQEGRVNVILHPGWYIGSVTGLQHRPLNLWMFGRA